MLFVVGINKALHQCSVFCRNIPRKSVICLNVHHCIFGICLWLRHRPTKVRVTQKSDCSDLACPEITPPPWNIWDISSCSLYFYHTRDQRHVQLFTAAVEQSNYRVSWRAERLSLCNSCPVRQSAGLPCLSDLVHSSCLCTKTMVKSHRNDIIYCNDKNSRSYHFWRNLAMTPQERPAGYCLAIVSC